MTDFDIISSGKFPSNTCTVYYIYVRSEASGPEAALWGSHVPLLYEISDLGRRNLKKLERVTHQVA